MRTAIDLFAGAGGFTTGAERAGFRVLWAANHWPAAVETSGRNHPDTRHVCQDLQQADWTQVPAADVVLASPACQGHSRARGKERPHHDATRSTAWAVVSCAEYHRPAAVVVENVAEFQTWQLFPAWRLAMESLGYSLAPHVLDAADYGTPQNRRRVFIVCTRSSAPIRLELPKQAHIPASTFIDWTASMGPIETPRRAARTLRIVEQGRRDFGERFLFPYYGSTRTGRDLARPIGTIMTRDRWAVVDGPNMRMLTVDETRAAMGFPAGYWLPPTRRQAVHLLGNAVCPPVVATLLETLERSI